VVAVLPPRALTLGAGGGRSPWRAGGSPLPGRVVWVGSPEGRSSRARDERRGLEVFGWPLRLPRPGGCEARLKEVSRPGIECLGLGLAWSPAVVRAWQIEERGGGGRGVVGGTRILAEMDFDEAIEWLSSKEGKSVYIEVGTKDPTYADSVTAPLAMHVKLGGVEPASETDKDRLMVVIALPELQRSRIYLDPAAVTKVEAWLGNLRLWFHDAFYVGFSGGH
jgi:hypothetical protein